MTDPAIETNELTKRFDTTAVVDVLDLRVERGTVLALLGPNGSGKTTTVRMLATLLRPSSGTAKVCGFDLCTHPEHVRARIGLTGQFSAVDPNLSGTENVEFIAHVLGYRRRAARSIVGRILEQFHLGAAADQLVRTYSGGMRRRLDLATAFLTEPDVLFLDEPTTGLDPVAREELWDLVRTTVAGGCSVLLTTQYLQEADTLADDIVVLNHGRKIAHGTPAELKALAGEPVLTLRTRTGQAEMLHAALTATGWPIACHEGASTGVTVPGHHAADVIAAVQQAGVIVESLSLREPDLDDVFRNLMAEEAQ